jgi:hypothetical protein
MAKIKDVIENLTNDKIKPEKVEDTDPVVPVEDEELPEAAVLNVVERITKPWHYGDNLCRFAREEGLTLQQVKAIKAEVDKRLKEMADLAAAEKALEI